MNTSFLNTGWEVEELNAIDMTNYPNEMTHFDEGKDIQILSISYDSSDTESNQENDTDHETSNEVPMSVTFIFLFIYMITGAYVFKQFENWSFVQSIYFVFVTLTTIGKNERITK